MWPVCFSVSLCPGTAIQVPVCVGLHTQMPHFAVPVRMALTEGVTNPGDEHQFREHARQDVVLDEA